ncbi:uncharacterized [Tachysurus ichikawai]
MGSVLSSSHTFNIKPLHVSGVTCAPEHSSVSPRAFDMVNYRRRPRGATFWSPVGGILNFTYKQNCRWTHRGAFVRRSHKAVLVHSNLNTIAGVKTRQRAAEVLLGLKANNADILLKYEQSLCLVSHRSKGPSPALNSQVKDFTELPRLLRSAQSRISLSSTFYAETLLNLCCLLRLVSSPWGSSPAE